MKFFKYFDEAGEVRQGLLKLKDMTGSTMCKLQEIDIDELRDVILFIIIFELFDKLDKMRALAKFFPDPKAILIWVVNVFELMHKIGSAFFGNFVDSAVVTGSI